MIGPLKRALIGDSVALTFSPRVAALTRVRLIEIKHLLDGA